MSTINLMHIAIEHRFPRSSFQVSDVRFPPLPFAQLLSSDVRACSAFCTRSIHRYRYRSTPTLLLQLCASLQPILGLGNGLPTAVLVDESLVSRMHTSTCLYSGLDSNAGWEIVVSWTILSLTILLSSTE